MYVAKQKPPVKLKFEDVAECRTIAELNAFTREYIEERGFKGKVAKRTAWVLFYTWKKTMGLEEK